MVEGIDISDFQTVISFRDVLRSGRKFVYAKATQGTYNIQDTFGDYKERVGQVPGLLFGAYHFFDWKIDPTAQAQFFLSVYTPATGDLPPSIDAEGFTDSSGNPVISASDATAAIAAFNQEVEKHLNGAKVLIYTYWAAIKYQYFYTDSFAGHPLWLAEPDVTAPDVPATWTAPRVWQRSPGPVQGIVELTDRDSWMGTQEELAAFTLKL